MDLLKPKVSYSVVALVLLMFSNQLQADNDDVNWVGSVEFGTKRLNFEEGRVVTQIDGENAGTVVRNSRQIEEDFLFAGVGIGFSWRQFFFSVNADLPIGSETYTDEFQNSAGASTETDGEFERYDWDATVGVSLHENWTVFGGYKYGRTEFDVDPRSAAFGQLPPGYSQEYEEDGYYLGGQYAYFFGDLGSLSFSVAYADLDGDYSESGSFGTPLTSETDSVILRGPTTYSGDADGFSYALQWTGYLSRSWAYTVALKYQEYELDGRGTSIRLTNPNLTGQPAEVRFTQNSDIDTTEELTSLSVGLTYRF